MQTEVEAKFIRIDHEAMRQKLREAGAECLLPMRLMKRAILDYPDKRLQREKDAYVRVRDEGDRVTMTYKQFDAHSVDGAKEIETVVESYDQAVALFQEIGLRLFSVQETRRETWKLGEVEVVLDEWPWLDPFMEIEAESVSQVQDAAATLGLAWEDAIFGGVMNAYCVQYSHLDKDDTVGNLPLVQFGAPLPDLLDPARYKKEGTHA